MNATNDVQAREERVDRMMMAITGSIRKNEADNWRQYLERVKHFVDGAEVETPTCTESSTTANCFVPEVQKPPTGKDKNPSVLSQTSASVSNGGSSTPPTPQPSAYAMGIVSGKLVASSDIKPTASLPAHAEPVRESGYEWTERHVNSLKKLTLELLFAAVFFFEVFEFAQFKFNGPVTELHAQTPSQKELHANETVPNSWKSQAQVKNQSRRHRKVARQASVTEEIAKAE